MSRICPRLYVSRTLLLHCMKSFQIQSFFWSVFSCIWTEYGDLLRKSPYSVRTQENTGLEKTPYLETFHGMLTQLIKITVDWSAVFSTVLNF